MISGLFKPVPERKEYNTIIVWVLDENEIGIFAVSTYNTDYIFVKSENFERAMSVLKEHGYQVV